MAERNPHSLRTKLTELIGSKDLFHKTILTTGLLMLSIPALNELYRSNKGSHELEQNYTYLLTKSLHDQKVNAIYRDFYFPNRAVSSRFSLPQKSRDQIEALDKELAKAKQTRLDVLRQTPGFLPTDQADNLGRLGFIIAAAPTISKLKTKSN